jgi:hypothetical protein
MLLIHKWLKSSRQLLLYYSYEEDMRMLGKLSPAPRIGLIALGLLAVVLLPALVLFHLASSARVSAAAKLWPAAAGPGSTIVVTGSGYSANESVKTYFQTPDRGVTVVTDARGSFSVPLRLPTTYVPGTQYYVFVDSNTYSTKLPFSFTRVNLSLSYPKETPVFGSLTSFKGAGFLANETVNLTWSQGAGRTVKAGTVVAGSDGSFSTTLTMPSIPQSAQYNLLATGSKSGFSTGLPLTGVPAILFDPSDAPAGTVIHVKGGSFASGETVDVSFQDIPVVSAQTDMSGAFTTTFTVPASISIGYYDAAVRAVGRLSRRRARHSFTVVPIITLRPNGFTGTEIQVIGKNFTPRGGVSIFLVCPEEGSGVAQAQVASLSANNKGVINAAIQINTCNGLPPEDVSFIEAVDQTTGAVATATFFSNDSTTDAGGK